MQTILVVNSNLRNQEILAQYLEKQGFQAICTSKYVDLAQILAKDENLSVAVVDITGFDPEIWTYCEQMHTKMVPFLVIAPHISQILQQECALHGSSGILTKPLVPKDLMYLICSLLGE